MPTKPEDQSPEATAALDPTGAVGDIGQEKAPHRLPPSQIEQDGKTAYTLERLIGSSEELIGYPSHETAGALEDRKDKHLTVAEAKKIVSDWLKQPASGGEGS